MAKNIEMNYRIDSGYEVLYPSVMVQNIGDFQSYMQENYYNKSETNSTFVTNSYLSSNYYNRSQTDSTFVTNSYLQNNYSNNNQLVSRVAFYKRYNLGSKTSVIETINGLNQYHAFDLWFHGLAGTTGITGQGTTYELNLFGCTVMRGRANMRDVNFYNLVFSFLHGSGQNLTNVYGVSLEAQEYGVFQKREVSTFLLDITNNPITVFAVNGANLVATNLQFEIALIGYKFY